VHLLWRSESWEQSLSQRQGAVLGRRISWGLGGVLHSPLVHCTPFLRTKPFVIRVHIIRFFIKLWSFQKDKTRKQRSFESRLILSNVQKDNIIFNNTLIGESGVRSGLFVLFAKFWVWRFCVMNAIKGDQYTQIETYY
jgi:hypothetical protein